MIKWITPIKIFIAKLLGVRFTYYELEKQRELMKTMDELESFGWRVKITDSGGFKYEFDTIDGERSFWKHRIAKLKGYK